MEENREYDIDKEEDFYGQNNKDNSLEKELKNFSEINLGTINKNTTTQMTSLETFKEMLNDIKVPYPNVDEIPLIKLKDENHFENDNNIDDYILTKFDDNKFNICRLCNKKQNKFFCKNCNKNICDICNSNCISNKHSLIELKELLDEAKENKKNINLIISKNYILPKEKENFDGIEKKNKNYEIIDEYEINNEIEGKLKEYTNDFIFINAIIYKNSNNYFHYINIKECLIYLRKKFDYITINYNIKENDIKVRIFGENFVKNNKNICQIIYEDECCELTQFLNIKNLENNKILEIKLIGINNIVDASYMFYDCESLKSLPDIPNWNTKNVTDMSHMFWGCKSLISLPDISNWNTKNVTNMSRMFFGCLSLISLPDISKWNTNNVTNMSFMFACCKTLISLPDISKWNTIDTMYMNDMNMFFLCQSLKMVGNKNISDFKSH